MTRTGRAVLASAVLLWLLARLMGGRTLFLLAYGCVLVLVLARALGGRRPALAAERSGLQTRLRQGVSAEVLLTVRAPARALVVLEERLHPHLGRPPVLALSTRSPEVIEHRYLLQPRLRGVYDVGPLVATWTDPFGLTRRESVVLPAQQIVVHPSTEPVTDRPLTRQWEDPPVRPPRSKPWPTGFELYGMRDYERGDDLRRVVWRAVARTGRMLTRESEQGITDRVCIVLDTDAASYAPGDPSEDFEAAVSATASLATRHLHDGFAVDVLTPAGPLVAAARGDRDRVRVLDALAGVERGPIPLATALDQLVRSGRREAHTLVVTARLTDADARRARVLVDGGLALVLVVLTSERTGASTLRRAAGSGGQVVALRPREPLDAAFRATGEQWLVGARP